MVLFSFGRVRSLVLVKSWTYPPGNPTECSGPPHLLGPWGSAGRGRCEWPPHDTAPGRPLSLMSPFRRTRCGKDKKTPDRAPARLHAKRLLDLVFAEFD